MIAFKKHILFLFLALFVFSASAQKQFTISGYITDASSGERLSGATIFLQDLKKGTISNEFGFYSLSVITSEINIEVRFVGFQPFFIDLKINSDTVLNIPLFAGISIGEVEITSQNQLSFLRSTNSGIHRITAKEVERTPMVLGEPDLLKAIQLLPGVSFAGEGSTGFSVRGGSPDQTLIQLDGVPVYNVNHLWGFMSAFNNDAINDAKLYKGSLPARFGGRLSSVLDVSMKEGNMKKKQGTFSVSPIAGRFTLEGPLKKDKASFMISGRTTWANLMLMAYQKLENQNTSNQIVTYGFWDINAKTNYIFNSQNRVYLSFYTGRDAFFMEDKGDRNSDYVKFSYNWQNLTGVLRWNHVFSPRLFANFTLYNSRFRQEYFNQFNSKGKEIYKGYNNLNDISQKGDFDWMQGDNISLKFGYIFSIQKFSPEIISFQSDSNSFVLNKDIFTNNFISEVYFETNIDLTHKFKTTLGLRAGNMVTEDINYPGLQPRVSARYLFSEKWSAKLSYSRMKQYLHQLQNTTLGIPTELWVASTNKIAPGISDLFSAGVYWSPVYKYQFLSEVFYTGLKNVIRYKDGTLALKERDDSWEDFVAVGNGKAYGIELMAEKTGGKLIGWIAYTLSKSTRQFDEINFGNEFPYEYDRRHQININFNYAFEEFQKKDLTIRREFSANFNFASGRYITLAEQEYQGIPLPLMEDSRYRADWFAKRSLINSVNNYQMPDFHHLNLSYRIERKSLDKTIVWNFSVYNIYNRLNPWYYYKQGNQMKQVTFFPIIPSVSFTYKW